MIKSSCHARLCHHFILLQSLKNPNLTIWPWHDGYGDWWRQRDAHGYKLAGREPLQPLSIVIFCSSRARTEGGGCQAILDELWRLAIIPVFCTDLSDASTARFWYPVRSTAHPLGSQLNGCHRQKLLPVPEDSAVEVTVLVQIDFALPNSDGLLLGCMANAHKKY